MNADNAGKLKDSMPYSLSALTSFEVAIPVIFATAWLLAKFIDEKGIGFSKWIYEKIVIIR